MSAVLSLLLCGCREGDLCKADCKSGGAPEKIQVASATKSTRSASTVPSDRTTSGTSQVAELDEIDQRVSDLIHKLRKDEAAPLVVRHVKDNMYKVDGRRVRLSLSNGSDACIMVQEDSDAKLPLVPLETYLQQAAFVSRALHGLSAGSPAVAQVPADKRLTFAATACGDGESLRRVKAMRLACEQARLREEAAEAYAREASAEGWRPRSGIEDTAAVASTSLQQPPGVPTAPAEPVEVQRPRDAQQVSQISPGAGAAG
ncbi:unnamed protein product [Symbiodinium natans]|uniref:Uncharacterized protein n=1 Tax=Symbiodinium natans TaxID=878477 RepID=A0A812RIY1_9DINO|nr:unnamed protein product [Symbiodinium natans]